MPSPLIRQSAARDEAVQRIAELLANREGRTAPLDRRTALTVQALLGSSERNTGGVDRARQLGMLLVRQASGRPADRDVDADEEQHGCPSQIGADTQRTKVRAARVSGGGGASWMPYARRARSMHR